MKAKNITPTTDIGSTNFTPSIMNRPTMTARSRTEFHEVIERPGHCIGRLLALQQTDGVDGSTNQLFRGQFDDAFGIIDPACDIHTDRHILQDALLRKSYETKMSSE